MKTPRVVLSLILIPFFFSAAANGLAQVDGKAPTTPLAEAVKLYKAGLYQEAIDAFVQLGNKAKDRTERMKTQIYLGYTYFTIDNKEVRGGSAGLGPLWQQYQALELCS